MFDILTIIIIVAGLCLFETISSIDNAIINAEVLSTMGEKSRKWFLLWGLLFAVFVVRGLLPWLIVWVATPGLGPVEAFTATLTGDPEAIAAIHHSAPYLLMGGGIFLLFLFLHWIFLEPKNYGLRGEKFIQSQGVWFFAIVSILLTIIVWYAMQKDQLLAFAAVVGSTAFFIVHGFKQNAEHQEQQMRDGKSSLSDLSKLFYLEIIDTTFSIDGVLGAFAFTVSVPLILLGNGLGAFVVREITIRNIDSIKLYRYLKNGAMYSILFLGMFMVLEGFGYDIPDLVAPIITFTIIGAFFWMSLNENKKEQPAAAPNK